MTLQIKHCTQCSTEAPASAQFCAQCGTPFPLASPEPSPFVCEQCETPLPGGSRFCPGCGQAFDEPVPVTTPAPSPSFRPKTSPEPVTLDQPQSVPVSVQLNMPLLLSLSHNSEPGANYGWFSEALQLFRANALVWIIATVAQLIPFVVSRFVGFIFGRVYLPEGYSDLDYYRAVQSATHSRMVAEWLVSVPLLVMLCRLNCATYRMANKQVRGEKLRYGDIWQGGPGVAPVFWLTLLIYIGLMIGLTALVLPGLLLLALASPAYALAAEGVNVFEALRRSIVAMKRDWFNATVVVILCWLLILVSMLPIGLGLLITYPIYKLLVSLACRDMIGMPQALHSDIASVRSYADRPQSFVSQPTGETKATPPHKPTGAASSILSGISATRGMVVTIGGLLVILCLAVGFWLFHLAHPFAPTTNVNASSSVVATSDNAADGSMPAPVTAFPVHWGKYTITREDIGDEGVGKQQRVRILDVAGRTLWQAEDASISSVSECQVTSAIASDLEILTDAGAHYRDGRDYFFSRTGGLYLLFTNPSSGEDGFDVTKFTRSKETSHPNISVTYHILTFDGLPHSAKKEFHCVYLWDGHHYVNATENYTQDALAQASKARANYLKHWQENPKADYMGGGYSEDVDDGADGADRRDAIEYWVNAIAIGQGEDAKDWLLAHTSPRLASHLLQIEGELRKQVPQEGARLDIQMGSGRNLDILTTNSPKESAVTDDVVTSGKPIVPPQSVSPEERDPLKETAVPGSGQFDAAISAEELRHRLITDEDMSGRSLASLSVSYNVIYALHGYVFKRASLQRLFSQTGWYRPNPAFREQDLSAIEQANLKTIRNYERIHFGY